jgi:hypothetical protein
MSRGLALALLLAGAALPARAGLAGDQLCDAAGQSSGCLDTTWPSGDYSPPSDWGRGSSGGPPEPVGCPECRAATLRRLASVPELSPPTWSDSAVRDERLAWVLRYDRDTAGRLAPLLAARTGCGSFFALFAAARACPPPRPAPKVPPLPYTAADLVTNLPKDGEAQNRYNAAILDAYRQVWKKTKYRRALKLLTPVEFKAIIAQESSYGTHPNTNRCAYNKKCRGGVGLVQLTPLALEDLRKVGVRLVLNKRRDDRLDTGKTLSAALTLLALDYARLTRHYYAGKPPPDAILRTMLVLAYNAGPRAVSDAVHDAATEEKKPLIDVTLPDILESRNGKPPTLKKYTKGNFEKENRLYIEKIRAHLPQGDPLRSDR